MINDLDQAENDRDLNKGRETADARIVSLTFKELVLLFPDPFLITGIQLFDLINFRSL